jgi:hypothetical protein
VLLLASLDSYIHPKPGINVNIILDITLFDQRHVNCIFLQVAVYVLVRSFFIPQTTGPRVFRLNHYHHFVSYLGYDICFVILTLRSPLLHISLVLIW